MKIKDKVDDYLEEKFPKGKDKRRGEALVLIALAFEMGKEDVLEVLRKYPISANFDDAMDVLKFKEKVKAETLAEVGKVIDEMMKGYRKCNTLRERAMWDSLFKLKQKLGIGALK